jgi:hypothetical protein
MAKPKQPQPAHPSQDPARQSQTPKHRDPSSGKYKQPGRVKAEMDAVQKAALASKAKPTPGQQSVTAENTYAQSVEDAD